MEKKSYRDRILEGSKYRNADRGQARPVVEALDPNDRTLTFVIVNTNTAVTGIARLFAANRDLDETYNTAQGITVNVLESSHKEIKTKSLSGGFRIQGIQIVVTTSLQLSNPLTIIDRSATGSTHSRTWQPENYKDPRNFDSLMIKTQNFSMLIDGEASIELTLRASEEVRIITHIKDLVKPINTIKDRAVVESAAPYKSY